jgi:hypothetical protein
MKVLELIHDIQAAALPLRDNPPEDESVLELEDVLEPFSVMGRPLWQSPPEIAMAKEVDVADDRISKEDLRQFMNLSRVRISELRKRVAEMLSEAGSVSLDEVLDKYPPEDGMLEVIGYIMVALENEKNIVTEEESQSIRIPGREAKAWRIPKVIFCK